VIELISAVSVKPQLGNGYTYFVGLIVKTAILYALVFCCLQSRETEKINGTINRLNSTQNDRRSLTVCNKRRRSGQVLEFNVAQHNTDDQRQERDGSARRRGITEPVTRWALHRRRAVPCDAIKSDRTTYRIAVLTTRPTK